MKSHFKDSTAIKKQNPNDHPNDAKNTWWDCKQPQYDQRSSCFVNTGTHYGIGNRQPVGHSGNAKQKVDSLPYGRHSTMEVDEAG